MKTLCTLFLLTLIAAAFAACDTTNPIEDPHREHALHEIDRLAFVLNGEEIVVIEDNTFADGNPDTIHVHAGEETALIHLEATTEEGEAVHLAELGEEYSLRVQKLDPNVAEVEQHAEDRWSFHLLGKAPGTTPLVLEFLHGAGESAHPDYVTPTEPGIIVEVVDHALDH